MIAITIRLSSLAALLAASSALAQSTAGVGSLQGSVTDLQNRPLAGGQITYQLIAPPATGNSPEGSGNVAADAGGAFLASGLPAGNYMLCASLPSAPYLDPCVWQQPVSVVVSAGATSSRTIVRTKGVFLKVRINDPSGLLPQVMDGLWTPRKLLVGVKYGYGAYQAAQNTGVDGAGRDYQLIVPAGVAFKLWLFSSDVAVADSNGAPVDTSGSLIPFQATAGQDQAFTFTVSGPAAGTP